MKAPKSYEEGMERLNAILAKMQDEQTTLAEAVKLYAEVIPVFVAYAPKVTRECV